MDKFDSLQSEKYVHLSVPLKILKVVSVAAIIIGMVWGYIYYQNISNQRNALLQEQQEKTQPEEKTTLVNKQTQEAIQKRDASLCPQVASPFTNIKVPDAGCVSAIKNLTTLDTVNTIIVRAIKEKNEKLCDTVEKSFKEVCIQAVRDAKNGVVKTITNPLLGR